MDSISSEEQKTRVDTNWEERLEKARAQREAVLRARGAEGVTKVQKPFADPATGSVDMAEKMRFGVSSGATKPKAKRGVAARSPWRRVALVGFGFCAGIGVGVGIMATQNQFLSRDTLAESAAAPTAPEQNSAPATVAVQPEVIAQAVAVSGTTPLPAKGPSVLDELIAEIVPLSSLASPNLPQMPDVAVGEQVQLAALNVPLLDAPIVDALPNVGEPAKMVTLQTPEIGRAVAPALQDIAPSLAPFVQDRLEVASGDSQPVVTTVSFQAQPDATAYWKAASALPMVGPASGIAGLYIAAPERPALLASLTVAPTINQPQTEAGVILASVDDDLSVFTEHRSLSGAPLAGVLPTVDVSLPAPAIPGAKDMEMAIFAAGTVNEAALETTQVLVESYGLPVIAVRRVGYRISQNHVRYYDPETAEAASLLAAKIDGIARDFTRSDVNPAPGTLEIYLAGASRVVSRPVRTPQPTAEDRMRESVLAKLRGRLEQ